MATMEALPLTPLTSPSQIYSKRCVLPKPFQDLSKQANIYLLQTCSKEYVLHELLAHLAQECMRWLLACQAQPLAGRYLTDM